VLEAFQARHGVTDMVAIADAAMLSAPSLDVQDAGVLVHRGVADHKPPTTWPSNSTGTGNYSPDGQALESTRIMGTGRNGECPINGVTGHDWFSWWCWGRYGLGR
jgi:hypothetical protein